LTLGGTVTSNGQSFSGTIANLGTVTTADINGGTIDGVAIGGAVRGAGNFTTLDATGNTTLGDASTDTVTAAGAVAIQGTANTNYSLVLGKNAGAGLFNIYASGTAANYFAGVVNLEDGTALLPSLVNNGDPNTGLWFPAADTVAVSTAGSERLRIDSAGTHTITAAGINTVAAAGTLSLRGGQIGFPATQVASSDANTLDDYEEGDTHSITLTPNTSGSITLDSTFNQLAYTKIGRMVHVQGDVVVSAVSSPAGTFLSFSLPFVAAQLAEISGRACGTAVWFDSSPGEYTVCPIVVDTEASATAKIYMTAASIANPDQIYISISYAA
jgi:hypothetical protein